MKNKKFLLLSAGLITSATLPFAILSTSNSTNYSDRAVTSDRPNIISFNNESQFTFTNLRHYQYNFKDGTAKANYYFNQGMTPSIYKDKDYSIATIKAKGERDNKFENQEQWNDVEQEWEVTFNKTAPYLKIEGWDHDMWSNSPRFGIVVSKSLKIVPNSMVITMYKSTKGESIETSFIPEYVTDEVNKKGNRGLNFQRDDITPKYKIPNKNNYDWQGRLTSFNRWTTWLNSNYEISPNATVSDWYKERVFEWSRGGSANNQPIRAYFLAHWRSELDEKLNKQNNRHLYPPTNIVQPQVSGWINKTYSSPMLDNIGTIIGFGYNTGSKPTSPQYYDDQHWFKITFKTIKNDLLFKYNNSGNLAYVMAGFTTFDWNTDVYSFNWKAADINPKAINYAIEVRETKKDPSLDYLLPTSTSFKVKGPTTSSDIDLIDVPHSKVILSNSNTSRANQHTWFSRTFNGIDTKDSTNKILWDNFYRWKLEGTIENFDEDFWDFEIHKWYKNPDNTGVFDVKYVFNQFKYERIQAKNAVYNFSNLSPAQKDFYANLIKTSKHTDDVRKLVDTTNSNIGLVKNIDQKMGELKQKIQEANNLKNQPEYKNASQKDQNAFNSVINAKIAQTTATGTENSIDLVQATKGIQDLENAIEKLKTKQAIKDLPHLNQNQKNALYTKVDNAREENNKTLKNKYSDIKTEATNLNTGMDKLKRAKELAETYKTDKAKKQTYDNSTETARKAFNNALKAINNKQNQNIALAEVDKLTNAMNAAISGLDGDRNLQAEKTKAINLINELKNLNNAQKQDYIRQINAATTPTAIKAIITKNNTTLTGNAKVHDDNMKNLKETVARATSTKQTDNYKFASQSPKSEFDSAYNDYQAKKDTNISSSEASNLNTRMSTAISKLDGANQLTNKKNEAKLLLNELTNINENQKNVLKQKIQSAPDIATIEKIIKKQGNTLSGSAKTLDEKMSKLKEVVQNATNIKPTTKYTQSSNDRKNTFNVALDQGTANLQGSEVDSKVIQNTITPIENAINNLNGETELSNAKTKAKNLVDSLKGLNNAQKTSIKNDIDSKNTKDEINAIISQNGNNITGTAKNLDNAMSNFKTLLDKADKVKPTTEFTNSTPEAKNAFTTAHDAANSKKDTNLQLSEVQTLNANLANGISGLNGDEQLKSKRVEANKLIDNLTNLNNNQKQALKNQINTSSSDEIDAIIKSENGNLKGTAKVLDDQMQLLANAVEEAKKAKTETRYIEGTRDSKTTLRNAIAEGEQRQAGSELSSENIKSTIERIKNAINQLDGEAELSNAKNNAKTLINNKTLLPKLNDAQRQELIKQIDQATTKAAVNAIISKNGDNLTGTAKVLDNAMKDLEDAITAATSEKETPNYTDASTNLQNAFDNALSKAKEDQVKNLTTDEITKLVNDLTSATSKLDGNSQLKAKRENAIKLLDDLKNINSNQKTLLKSQINSETSLSKIDAIIKKEGTVLLGTAKDLDTQMGNLTSMVEKANRVKITPKYTQSSGDTKEALNNALTQGNQRLSGSELDSEKIKVVVNHLDTAINNLNGDQALENAKTKAISEIDKLENLNEAQKTALKAKVNELNNIDDISDIIDRNNEDVVTGEAKDLDDLMQNLKTKLANSEKIVDNNDISYSESSNEIKEQIKKLNEEIKNKIANDNLSKDEVNSLIEKLDALHEALDGNEKLDQAKKEAINLLDRLTNLNEAQKENLKEEIKNSNSVSKVENIIKNSDGNIQGSAKELDDAMSRLKNAITKGDNAKSTSDYINASNKSNLNWALNNGKNNVDKNISKDKANEIADSILQAISNLNGDERLVSALDKLKNFVDEHEFIHDETKYNDSVEEVKEHFDLLFNKAKEIIANNNQENHSVDELENLYDDLTAAFNKLGLSNEQLFKNHINNLPNLNEEERNDLINAYKENPEKEAELLSKAQDINAKKQTLIDLVNSSNNLPQSEKDQLLEDIQNTNGYQNPDDLMNLAERINNILELAKKVVDALINLPDNYNSENVISIKKDIAKLKELDVDTEIYEAALNTIIQTEDLKISLKEFENSTVKTENFDKAKAKLVLEISKEDPSILEKDLPVLAEVLKTEKSKREKIKLLAKLEISLVDALLTRNLDEYAKAYNEITKNELDNLEKLNEVLDEVSYFENPSENQVLELPSRYKDKLEDLNLYNSKEVLRSSVLANYKVFEKISPWFFVGATFAFLSIITLGAYYIYYKKKQK